MCEVCGGVDMGVVVGVCREREEGGEKWRKRETERECVKAYMLASDSIFVTTCRLPLFVFV